MKGPIVSLDFGVRIEALEYSEHLSIIWCLRLTPHGKSYCLEDHLREEEEVLGSMGRNLRSVHPFHYDTRR